MACKSGSSGPEKRAKTSSTLFENLMTFDELVLMLRDQYSRRSIYNWVHRAGMPHKKIRGKLWFPRDDVIDWLQRSS